MANISCLLGRRTLIHQSLISKSIRNMCIIFMCIGDKDPKSDYRFILASNRDEQYDRPSKTMAPWAEDPQVIGGRDLECNDGGTWFAVSPSRKKIGALLNLPRFTRPNAKTRGKIVKDYVKSDINTKQYVTAIKDYVKECNEFIFVSIELGLSDVLVQTYNNSSDQLSTWSEQYLGFSNSLPQTPLKKVEGGKKILQEICERHKTIDTKQELIEELIALLRSSDKHLPDPELKAYRPEKFEHLSSIFVQMPKERYGTRTHTIVLVTKSGHMDVIERTLLPPIDVSRPNWGPTEFHYDLCKSQ